MANKESIINVRVTEEERKEFKQICEDLFSTPSSEIYKFIKSKIKQHENKTYKDL